MAAGSSSSSSNSESESGASDGGMARGSSKGRSLPQLPGLARLASSQSAPAEAATASAAAPATAAVPASAISAAQPAGRRRSDASSAPTPAAALPELAAVLRLSDSGGAEPLGKAAVPGRSDPSAATNEAAGRTSEAISAAAAQDNSAPRGNIVTAPAVPVVRVNVCQGKSCAKRGAADLLAQAAAAGAGQPGVQVSGCKCLGKCKKAPAVRVRAGRERPTILTQVSAPPAHPPPLSGCLRRSLVASCFVDFCHAQRLPNALLQTNLLAVADHTGVITKASVSLDPCLRF